jgi:hypothetical protein
MINLLGWRKTGYWAVSLLALIGGARQLGANFTEFREGVLVLAGLALGAHVTQLATSKKPPAQDPQ